MRRLFSYLAVLSFALNAWSYNERGNSGFSLICDNPDKTQFYDSYEAEHRYNLKPVYPENRDFCDTDSQCLATSMRIARRFLQRLPVDSHLRQYALARLANFTIEINIKEDIEILPVNDVGIGFIPKGCKLRQTIVQRQPKFPEDMRYIISKDYWDLLSIQQKGVAIAHEILYGYYAEIKVEPVSSENIRYLNALIISGKIESYSPAKYKKVIEQVYGNK